jgi:hypothetical protein
VGDNVNLPNDLENFNNNNLEFNIDMIRLKQELKQKIEEYNKTIRYMLADAPIGVLCLPPTTESILIDQGFLRVYDLFDADLIKIKGIGITRLNQITTGLDKFLSML